jgi:hypothetical protein
MDTGMDDGHGHNTTHSLLNVCELWPPQNKQKKRPFPQFPIEDGHDEWWITTISYLTHTEEKNRVPSYWNTHVLQVWHLIFFFVCQACNRSCMTGLSCLATYVLFHFDYVLVWGERVSILECLYHGLQKRGEDGAWGGKTLYASP